MSTPAQIGSSSRSAQKSFQSQKDCLNWKQGSCRFGSKCKFRHDPAMKGNSSAGLKKEANSDGGTTLSELTTNSNITTDGPNAAAGAPDNARGNTVEHLGAQGPSKLPAMCRDWKAGKCLRGARCRYRHAVQEVVAISTTESPASPINPKDYRRGFGQPKRNAERKIDGGTKADVKNRADGPQDAEARARAREEEIGVAEAAKIEAERREAEARQVRERAALVEKARLAHEKRERDKMLKEERARKAEEERQRREAERLAREKEAEEAKKHRQAQREKDAAVVEQYMVQDSSLVTCAAGLHIRNVVTGFDLCKITIKNLPRDARRPEIADLFLQQGVDQSEFFISQVKPESNSNTLEAIVLANAQHGQAIAVGLEGIEFRNEVLNFSVSENVGVNAMDAAARNTPFLLVSWKAPSSTVVATYTSMEEAREKARTLDRTIFKGRQIRAEMNERPRGVAGLRHFVESSVRIWGLPPNIFFDTEFTLLTGTWNHRSLKSVSYDLEDSFTLIRERLSQSYGVRMDTYETMANGLGPEGEAKVKVQFEDWEDAKKAQASIEQIREFNSPTYKGWLPQKPVRYTIKIPRQQYEVQKKQWDALSEKKKDVDAHVLPKIGDRGDLVFIQVMGQDKKAVGILKVRVESLVAGEKLNSTYWHSSFASNQSKGPFNRIYSEKRVFVRNDFKTRSLRVFGEQQMVVEARQMIKDEVDRLAEREVTRIIDRGYIGFFLREGLDKLKELLGEENVQLNLTTGPCRITVKGGEEATHHLQRLIEEARTAMALGSILPGQIIEKDTCPVCYDDASNPEQLGCGHTYCSGCLKHFLTSAVDGKTFPLVCAGNDATCNAPIAIPLIQRFLPTQAFHALVDAAFLVYLEQHAQELKYCTTPNCKQIYRRRMDQTALQCPSCFSTICSACDEEAHEGMTCEERIIHKNPEEQERLNEELATASGFKKCPQCKIWIEKTEGCNHMTCKCGAHICWKCMGIFTADIIYPHMQSAHGNIYDDVPQGVNVQIGNMAHNVFLAGQVDELARIDRLRALERRQVMVGAPIPPQGGWAWHLPPDRQEAVVAPAPAPRTRAALAEDNRQRIENQRQVQQVADERRRREEVQAQALRQTEILRQAQERIRIERITNERTLWIQRIVDERTEAERRRAEEREREEVQAARRRQEAIRQQRQQEEENRGWCVVM